MNRWSWVAWYQSNTLRALLVALMAWFLDISGVAEDVAGDSARNVVDAVLAAAQGIALVWGVYARARQPTPPVTLTQRTADERNALESGLKNGIAADSGSNGGTET
jgi:hypothetical protein